MGPHYAEQSARRQRPAQNGDAMTKPDVHVATNGPAPIHPHPPASADAAAGPSLSRAAGAGPGASGPVAPLPPAGEGGAREPAPGGVWAPPPFLPQRWKTAVWETRGPQRGITGGP